MPRGPWPPARTVSRPRVGGRNPAEDEDGEIRWQSIEWTPEALDSLVGNLKSGHVGLRSVPEDRLKAAWLGAVAVLREPRTHPRTADLRRDLASLCRLSSAGLDAGLDCVLDGVTDASALELFDQVAERSDPDPSPVLVVLSSNLPGLSVQSLLPALAARRPILLKSPSSEPLFAPAFVDTLCRREPLLRGALAATTWSGGRTDLEAPVLDGVGRVIAYGGGETMADLGRRSAGKLVAHGPKISLAVVSEDALCLATGGDSTPDIDSSSDAWTRLVEGLARDIALFDQRGCLSIQAIYTDIRNRELRQQLASGLVEALAVLGERWPLGPAEPAELAHVRMVQDEAIMRAVPMIGATTAPSPSNTAAGGGLAGGVLVDPDPDLRPAPGRRWVRLHALDDLEVLPRMLEDWRGRLQGVALAGEGAWKLEGALRDLGASHLAPPGALQSPDIANWANGGVAPLGPFLE